MTAEELIKREILVEALTSGGYKGPRQVINSMDSNYIEEAWNDSIEGGASWFRGLPHTSEYILFFDIEGFRSGGEDTGLHCPLSAHYESKRVATKINGKWVSWVYWYGGSFPEDLPWIDEAIFIDCEETVEAVTVRKFKIS